MEKQTELQALKRLIEQKRSDLVLLINEQLSDNSRTPNHDVLAKSQELDILIVQYQRILLEMENGTNDKT